MQHIYINVYSQIYNFPNKSQVMKYVSSRFDCLFDTCTKNEKCKYYKFYTNIQQGRGDFVQLPKVF